ncbi:ribosomal protein S18-alanine N-acetyltransferase [Picrophilus oshimae]|uniref:Ribosomal protein s18 alanine acetyltransferase n=1 Tax=Picrophilus torridus (strain ATCC 700027 / DSM 9790 / JCM 10055 / NBRC 100828 / KAW 2/3) TaxID=1122961 RepID=Q6L124_PICTO|nr:ribosomal protein S18-alanine N-acetyltransferase [Picrophilus oshimae]AAT43328.1 ribosomal protein s18 alanine acetyltransferase [Picrophilus oshimae DSM 9789]
MAINFFGYVRKFEPKDIDRVMEIIKSSLSEYYTKGLILDLYRAWPDAFLVYDNFTTVLGFIIGSRYSGTEGRILLFAVDERYRSSGIGTYLLNEITKVMLSDGLSTMRLEVRTDNESAIRFYKKNGFSITSTLKNYYSDLSDAYLMWKII